MRTCLYFTSALSAGFFCWAVFAIDTALGAQSGQYEGGHPGEAPHGGANGLADPHATGGGLPQLDTSTYPSQLFWLAVTFAILYFIFSRRSLPEISGVLENRQQHIQSDLETAEKLKNDAEKAQNAYETSLKEARAGAGKAVHDVQEKLKAKAEKQSDSFRVKAEKDIQAMEERLQKVKEGAMDDMNTIAAEVASEAARKIVGINPDPEQAKTVVESLNGTNAKAA